MRLQQLDLLDREPRLKRKLDNIFLGWQLAARKNFLPDELHELQITDCQRDSVITEEPLCMRQYRVQQHSAVVEENIIGPVEEGGIPHSLERFECADGDDPIDLVFELFPVL